MEGLDPRTGSEPPASRLRLGLALLTVAIIVAAAHWPVLRARAYCFDDTLFVRENRLVTQPGWPSAARFFREVLHPSTVRGYYIPLTMTSLMVDYAIGRSTEDLTAFHRSNLALHVLCTLLIVGILFRLFGSLAAASAAGLLFGLHPLTVEPVAWVGERKTLLAACLGLSSILCYLEQQRGHGRSWGIASVVLFLLALLSKPTVVMLPLLLVLLDAWPLRRFSMRTVLEKWPYFLLALLSGVVTLVSHQQTAGILAPAAGNLLLWPLRSAYLLGFYLVKIVRPTDLSPVYTPPLPFVVTNPAVAAAVGLVLALTILVVLLARRTAAPWTGGLYFLLALAPTLGLVQYSWVIASDKYVYFAAPGILLVIASGLSAIWRRGTARSVQVLAWLIVLALLLLEARGVRAALRPWRDSLALGLHMEETAPNAPPALNRMGVIFGEKGDLDRAVAYLERAVKLRPEYAEARYNLGLILANQARFGEAIPQLEQAVALLPGDADAMSLLGVALTRAGRPAEAESLLFRAVVLNPDLVSARNQLGGLLVARGRADQAVEQFRAAAALVPSNPDLQFRLGSALVLAGHAAEAVTPLRHAIRLRPSWAEAINALAWLRATDPEASVRDTAEALELAGRAASLTGRQDPKVLDTLAAAEAAAGRFEEAIHTSAEAIDLAYERHAEALARQLEQRRELYKNRTPYIEPASARAATP